MGPGSRESVTRKYSRKFKDDLRAVCLVKAQEERDKLLNRLRLAENNSETARARAKRIIREATSAHNPRQPLQQSLPNPLQALNGDSQMRSWEELSSIELDELEVEIQQILSSNEADIVKEVDSMQFDADLASLSINTDEEVPCPVCLQANLVESHGLLGCPHEGFCIAASSYGLPYVKHRLAEALEEHQSLCGERLLFMIADLGTGVKTLVAYCDACDTCRGVL